MLVAPPNQEDLSLTTEPSPASVVPDLEQTAEDPPARTHTATFTQNSLLSIGRLFVSTAVALVLPAYLTHRLPIQTYSAWVLLLQLSAYVGYLDFGIQTGISKFVAEYDAKNDPVGANQRASGGLAIMVAAAVLGMVLVSFLAWQVPYFFGAMPAPLVRGVRLSLLFVGFSLSFGLVCAVPSAIFVGLQRYSIPMLLSLANRVLYTVVVVAAVLMHGGLAIMGAGVATVNVLTGLLQVGAWQRMASHVKLSLSNLNRAIVKEMLAYCSVMAVWSIGMLFVMGLDVTIVGHFDYGQTAFYSIATLPTNFIMSIMGAALGPLLPTASALSASRSPKAMGNLLSRLTRYSVLLLGLTGLPVMVAGYYILSLWVGHTYAVQTVGYLRILLLANIVRNICLPYATFLAATGSQKVAIAGASAEAVVNVTASILLVRHIGAIGVAYGTLIGAFVSVGMHFALSMHFTFPKFSISRARLFGSGVLRPLVVAVPSAVLVPYWWKTGAPNLPVWAWILWAATTLALAWTTGVNGEERNQLQVLVARRLRLQAG